MKINLMRIVIIFLLFWGGISCDDVNTDADIGKLNQKCDSMGLCDPDLVCNNADICISKEIACKYITCSNHGACIVEKSKAVCECDTSYHSNGLNCILDDNSNECLENTHNCSVNASCTDLTDGFTCQCNSAYVGDGVICNPIGNCFDNSDCSDGKICENYNCVGNITTCNPACENWQDCNNGYCELKADRCVQNSNCNNGKICKNHNCVDDYTPECVTNIDCENNEICENNKCVVSCIPKTCSQLNRECGYISDGCEDSLNCGTCSNNETCNNNICKCNSGFHDEGGTCVVDGNCYGISCGSNEQCDENTGDCVCATGYRLKNNTCTDNSVIAGITSPVSMTSVVMISPSDFLKYAYKITLGRDYDIAGFNTWKRRLEINQYTESQVYEAFLGSPEVTNNPTLQDKSEMIKRAYLLLFKRLADSSDINYWVPNIKNYDGTGTGYTWYEFYHILTEGQEYYNNNCDTDYYSYGKALNNTTPLLKDLFAGTASFQSITQSTTVNISVQDNAGYNMMWDIGLPIIYDKNTSSYYAYNRVYNETTAKFNIITSKSTDGINFTQYGSLIFENSQDVLTLYDPHVTPDNLSCPKRYIMLSECNNIDGIGGANTCMSYTTTPARVETWSYPKTIIKGYNQNYENKSASTAVSLSDTQNRYLSWTIVDDARTWDDDGDESTYVKGMLLNNFFDMEEYSTIGTRLLTAIANINCIGEECNNKDQTDWKKEDGSYYLLYNGANYYRCIRPGHANLNDGSSDWHIKIRRSGSAIGLYTDETATIMDAERTDICGISYAKINEFNGELYLYVAYYPATGGNRLIRSKLLWK